MLRISAAAPRILAYREGWGMLCFALLPGHAYMAVSGSYHWKCLLKLYKNWSEIFVTSPINEIEEEIHSIIEFVQHHEIWITLVNHLKGKSMDLNMNTYDSNAFKNYATFAHLFEALPCACDTSKAFDNDRFLGTNQYCGQHSLNLQWKTIPIKLVNFIFHFSV